MPWNGSGQFNRTNGVFTGATVWDESRVAGRTVRSDDHDTHDEDIATGLENTVTRDGQNLPSANLPMGGFRHTNVDDAAARTDYAAAGQIQDQDLSHVVPASVGGTADAITLSPTPVITAYTAGQSWSFVAEATNTGATTINVSALGTRAVQKLGAALVAGDITIGDLVVVEDDGTQFQMLTPARTPLLTSGSIPLAALADGTDGELITWDASGVIATVGAGTSGQVLTSNGAGAAPTMQAVDVGLPRSYLAGLTLSNNSGDATDSIDIAVGEARSDANDADLTVPTVIGKDISATWASGGTAGTPTGGMSSSLFGAGAPVNDTWYHVILGLVSGTAEVGFDTSLTGANLVTDHSFTNTRRIGSVKRLTATNRLFTQYGDEFWHKDPPLDVDVTNQGTTATSRTLEVPTGLSVLAIVNHFHDTAGGGYVYIRPDSTDIDDEAPSNSAAPLGHIGAESGAVSPAEQMFVRTNTTSGITTRASQTGTTVRISTLAYIDDRGRND